MLKTKTPPTIQALRTSLLKAEEQRATLNAQHVAIQANMDQARKTLLALEARQATRSEEHRAVSARVQTTAKAAQQERAYSQLTGSAEELKEAETQAQQAVQYLEQLEVRQREDEAQDASQIASLQDVLKQGEQEQRKLTQELDALATTRDRLRRELGEALYAESDSHLTMLEQQAEEAAHAANAAKIALRQARADASTKLAEWPDLKREFARTHIAEDATSQALTDYIAFIELLMQYNVRVDQPRTGISTYSVLSELVIEQTALLELTRGMTSQLQNRRERAQMLLREYKANLARQ